MKSEQVFEILMREQTGMLLTYLRAIVGSPAAVDDIYQETMLTAWKKLDSFDKTRSFGPWLRGIAKNHALAHFRCAKRDMLMCNDAILEYLDQQLLQIELSSGDSWQEKTKVLHQCIEQLPEKYQQVVRLRYLEERKTAEVQQHVDISREALKKRLRRAKKQLFQCLQQKNILMAMS
ncbi:RNA polymerase sigma factor [Thalassotalea crassostreae]|uniref:RNA polymerase sigma factor n=1 Tax=Thalassotalea crassostreae TaxID=1763536 RepID=UPI000838169C|nr:sigma-70 family RNA polymerase sigma factor [Thalassotalea crassostreae]